VSVKNGFSWNWGTGLGWGKNGHFQQTTLPLAQPVSNSQLLHAKKRV
jgi:hypothetical protein